MAGRSRARKQADPIPKAKGRYHHGNLRQALIDAALELIRTDGAEALSLRALALHQVRKLLLGLRRQWRQEKACPRAQAGLLKMVPLQHGVPLLKILRRLPSQTPAALTLYRT